MHRVRTAIIGGLAAALVTTALASCEGGSRPRPSASPVVGDVHVVARSERGVAWTPSVAVDPPRHRVYVAWVEPTKKGTASYLAVSDDDGNRFTPPMRIGGWTDQVPLVRVADDGTLFLMWTHWDPHRLIDPKSEYSNPAWQVLETSTDGGRTFSDPVSVPDEGSMTATFFAGLAVSRDGSRVVVTWIDYSRIPGFGDGSDRRRQAARMLAVTSTDGGRTFGTPLVATTSTCVCCTPTAFLMGDRPGVAYRGWQRGGDGGDERDPHVALLSASGNDWSSSVVHHDGFHLKVCPHMGLGAAVDPTGRLFVDWWTGAEGRAGYWYTTSADGRSFSEPVQLVPLKIDPHGNDLSIAIDPSGTAWMPAVVFPGGRGSGPQVALWMVPSGEGPTEVPGIETSGTFPAVTSTADGVAMIWAEKDRLLFREVSVG